MKKELPANLSGRIGEIYIVKDSVIQPGTWMVVQDTPESAECCFDWRRLDEGLTREEAEERIKEYLSGQRPIPAWK